MWRSPAPSALLLVLLLWHPAFAQSAQRSALTGRVVDGTGAVLAGARVTLDGPAALGGPRTLETGTDGTYRFTGLLPGSYVLTAEADAFQRLVRDGLTLPVETTWTIDFRLEVSPIAEQVDVSAAPPLVDVTTAATPAFFGHALLQHLPTGRSLEAVLNLAPGVTDNVAFGGAQGSNGLSLDRVSLVEPVLGTSWVPVSYNWLEGVQVVALGAPAEYGQFTGAIANGVLRSGSNRYAGLAEYVAAVPGWTGDNTQGLEVQYAQRFAPRRLLSWWDANAQLGGPIWRDRLWFFAGVGTVAERYRPFYYDGPETSDRDEPRAVVKLDAAPARNVLTQGFYHRDTSDHIGEQLSDYQPSLDTAGARRRRNHAWNARATWTLGGSSLLEARTGGYTGRWNFGPYDPDRMDGPHPKVDWSVPLIWDNVLNYSRDERRNVTGSVRLGHAGRLFGTMHDLAVGLEFESTRSSVAYGWPGGRIDNFNEGVYDETAFWQGDDSRTRNRRTTIYLQDRWTVHPRVTLEPGLRIESYGGRPRDEQPVFSTRPVALRLGAAWDVRDDHRTVVRAHYGRYHDMLFSQIYAWHDRAGFTPRITGIELAPGQFQELRRALDAPPAYPIVDDLKQSHVDQYSAGVEHQAWRDLALEARYVHRRFGNFIGYVDQRIQDWVPFQGPDPGPDGRLGTADDGGTLTAYMPYWWPRGDRDLVLANPPGAFRSHDAVQLVARKRQADDWEAQASYTWSRSHGTIQGSQHSTATQGDLSFWGYGGSRGARERPAARTVFDYSELKLLGWFRSSHLGGAVVGAVYRWHTGTRWHRSARIADPVLNYADWTAAEAPYSRVMPSIGLLDLRLEKTLALGGAPRTVGLYADVLNVANLGRARASNGRSGAQFGHPTAWTDPRTVRLGLRYRF
jgi:hypothetical protein